MQPFYFIFLYFPGYILDSNNLSKHYLSENKTTHSFLYCIGGLWNYSEKYEEGQGSVMKSTVINVSKEQMAFSDFPIPKEFPMFMHHSLVQKYFQMYTDHFDLRRHIHFKKEVLYIESSEYADA